MLDDSDLDGVSDSLVEVLLDEGGWTVALCLVVLLGLFLLVWDNKTDCAKKQCPAGQRAQLTQHDCFCVEK
jgi:hypothetical protein